MRGKHGEFYPFGATVSADGENNERRTLLVLKFQAHSILSVGATSARTTSEAHGSFAATPLFPTSSNSTLRQGTSNSGHAAQTSSQLPALRVRPSGCRINENLRVKGLRTPITNLRSSIASVSHRRTSA
jgi:hypothetical protein